MHELQHFRQALLKRRAVLLADLESGASAASTVELDQARQGRLSRMDAMQQQAMAQETRRRAELELKRIAGALQRIEDHSYGYCIACGEAINAARLEIEPTALRCIDCAEEAG